MGTPGNDEGHGDGTAVGDMPGLVPALAALFDRLPEVVFFVKDREGRYLLVNETLLRRLGRPAAAVLGRTAAELFAPPLGERYLAQDRQVLRSGRPLEDLLELHLYPDGREGWCLTTKLPLRDAVGTVVGVCGVSRDVPRPAAGEPLEELAAALARMREGCGERLVVAELAAAAHMSVYRFTRRVRALFGLTPAQLIGRTRIDKARGLLTGSRMPLAQIALECGYCDQSAFTRQFRRLTGLTPAQYRASSLRRG